MRRSRGSLRHLSRSVSPRFWPIPRKEFVWALKPSPGPHPISRSIPVGVVLRDILGYATTMKEARRILGERKVEVDGRVVTDYKFPVGLMDVIHIRETDEYYRVVPHPSKFLTLHKIDGEEATFKLLRMKRKVMVKGGNLQLTFHDGRNHLVKLRDPFNPEEDVFSAYDTVKYSIPEREILDVIKFREGAIGLVIDGSNVGFLGRIGKIAQVFKRSRSLVELSGINDEKKVRTVLEYIFVVGEDRPVISLPEEVIKSG